MLNHHNRRQQEPPPNMDDLLTGTCQGCKATVVVARHQAQHPTQHRMTGVQPGTWTDLWSCACAGCKARVYLRTMTVDEVAQLHKMHGTQEESKCL